MSGKKRTPIRDKNGKRTHVWKNDVDKAAQTNGWNSAPLKPIAKKTDKSLKITETKFINQTPAQIEAAFQETAKDLEDRRQKEKAAIFYSKVKRMEDLILEPVIIHKIDHSSIYLKVDGFNYSKLGSTDRIEFKNIPEVTDYVPLGAGVRDDNYGWVNYTVGYISTTVYVSRAGTWVGFESYGTESEDILSSDYYDLLRIEGSPSEI